MEKYSLCTIAVGKAVNIDEVQARVDGKWSEWLNWGTWGAFTKPGSNLTDEQDDGTTYEYQLEAGGITVDLSRNNARTIMYTTDGKAYRYLEPLSSRTFWFGKGKDDGKYSFLIITADRKVYMADI